MSAIYKFIRIIFLVALVSACRTGYIPSTLLYSGYQVGSSNTTDSVLVTMLQPYTDSVNNSMNDIIAVSATQLKKERPEGTLGNMLADAMLTIARQKYSTHVDASLINFGGIRLNALPAGNITRENFFEIAPFDNIIVLQNVAGTVLQQLLNLVADAGGWPCAGMRYQIRNRQAVNITINDKAMEAGSTYAIAVTDYIANGGDHCEMLTAIPQQNNG